MIVIVAPYSPPSRSHQPNLGASRKIESVVDILGNFGQRIVLINTAHELEVRAPQLQTKNSIAGITVTEIFLPTYANRRTGKLLNLLFDASGVIEEVFKLGIPTLVWLYNGYAMESLIGTELQRQINCPVIQEMEDWHFSRSRGLNLKPMLDWFYWRKAAKRAAHVFAVNEALATKVRPLNPRVSLFPGVVADGVSNIYSQRPPFSNTREVVVGYFGGLSKEKGADCVLAMISVLPEGFKLIVTGAGPLQGAFTAASATNPKRIEFHGRVDGNTLNELICRCDVLLNPHSPIVNMDNGVFPFKVIEAVASGRVLVSTPLPDEGLHDVLQGVFFTNHNLNSISNAVVAAKNWYSAHTDQIRNGMEAAISRFGRAAIFAAVADIMSKHKS